MIALTIGTNAAIAPTGPSDSDGDGILDEVEVMGWRTLDGHLHKTDPNLRDTDGDRLADGEEAGNLVSEYGLHKLYQGVADPLLTDTDGDGLDDAHEVNGWWSTTSRFIQTDPNMADMDGDGLTDGEEAGNPVIDGSRVWFQLRANPLAIDTDGDGLDDAAELDLSLNAFHADTDKDGLTDWNEVNVIGSAPDLKDTDGDGYYDGVEVADADGLGLSPIWFDEVVDSATYADDFSAGMLLGEVAPRDSVAWLAGTFASGAASALPVAGWVVGGAMDLRDAVAAVLRKDWVTTGFSATGLIPYVGDSAKLTRITRTFIERNPRLAPAVAGMALKLTKVPKKIRLLLVDIIYGDSAKSLRARGLSVADQERLIGGRAALDKIDTAMKRQSHRDGDSVPFLKSGIEGELVLEKSVARPVTTQQSFDTSGCLDVCNPIRRRADVISNGVAHESKVGHVSMSPSTRAQIESDAYLIRTGQITGAHWHFYPSAGSNTLGADLSVIDLLEKLGIEYTIHLPGKASSGVASAIAAGVADKAAKAGIGEAYNDQTFETSE